jgi:hypothetical protein
MASADENHESVQTKITSDIRNDASHNLHTAHNHILPFIRGLGDRACLAVVNPWQFWYLREITVFGENAIELCQIRQVCINTIPQRAARGTLAGRTALLGQKRDTRSGSQATPSFVYLEWDYPLPLECEDRVSANLEEDASKMRMRVSCFALGETFAHFRPC